MDQAPSPRTTAPGRSGTSTPWRPLVPLRLKRYTLWVPVVYFSTQRGDALRNFQGFLLVVGATALGACAFYLALISYAEATGLGGHGPSDLGAAGLGFLLATGSVALGAIVGFVAAVWWIGRHDGGLWTRRIWIGVTLGLVTAVVSHFANRLPRVPTLIEMFEPWPAAAVLGAALGTLGGVIAKFTGSQRNCSAVDERRTRKQPP